MQGICLELGITTLDDKLDFSTVFLSAQIDKCIISTNFCYQE